MLKFHKKPLTTKKIFEVQSREFLIDLAKLWGVEINKHWKNEKIRQKILEKISNISLGSHGLSLNHSTQTILKENI